MGDGGCEGDAGGPREKASGAAEGQRPRSECQPQGGNNIKCALDFKRAGLGARWTSTAQGIEGLGIHELENKLHPSISITDAKLASQAPLRVA